ncbi:MAG TPA: SAM-dependent chlorinase/fluorinase [Chthonomonas sp.]|uniref:SAM hydrolase/SAM-dependent halogenase family protein n=1 Tax=Chthonomonas sp. TaxID=2282153 RepID=UPI002B4AFA0E|nr:SAM-dependent chlorinase/fluorinase [Chthonomonas sp.]HLI47820.1 SAM-dependent chlorinase/fluorinase [Chthonomonas sp.]
MGFTPRQPPLIALLTDFGTRDTYVGVMKGVILSIAPQAQIVDLTHEVTPQAVLEGSARLEAALPYFPAGTVFVAVVDPGVGSEREVCVVETEVARLVAPDNGLLTLPIRKQRPRKVAKWNAHVGGAYVLPRISATFHGRDIFAPLAAHLAQGLPLEAIGAIWEVAEPSTSAPSLPLHLLEVPVPLTLSDAQGRPALELTVLYVDRFGNLITNLDEETLDRWMADRGIGEDQLCVRCEAGEAPLVRTFSDVEVGCLLAYRGSGGRLELAIREGNAANTLGLHTGSKLYLVVRS